MKVSIVYSGSLSQTQGVVKVIRNLINKITVFEKNGIFIDSIISQDGFYKFNNNSALPNQKHRRKGMIRLEPFKLFFKNRVLVNSKFFQILVVMYRYIFPGYRTSKLCSTMDSNLFFFHDIFSSFFFLNSNFYKSCSVKVVTVIHSSENPLAQLFFSYPKLNDSKYIIKYLNKILKFVFENSDKVVFVSSVPYRRFSETYSNITYCYNGIENSIENIEKTYKSSSVSFVSIGSISKRKGLDLLIKSFLDIIPRFPNLKITLHICGEGPLKQELVDLVKMAELSNNIIFHGLQLDIRNFLLNADFFIMTSRDEGMPISILEAMNYSLPLLVSNVGGISEMTNSSFSWLFEPSVSSIVEAIESALLCNEEDRILMGKEAKRHFKNNFTSENMVENYVKIFSSIS